MTIKQCIVTYGWQMDCDSEVPYRSMDVNVDFENQGISDETQFHINAYDTDELTELFLKFCGENMIPKNTITNISIVRLYEEKA